MLRFTQERKKHFLMDSQKCGSPNLTGSFDLPGDISKLFATRLELHVYQAPGFEPRLGLPPVQVVKDFQ